ncbi:hypothetical protein HBB16_18225 [Pseudonocardia sp. MCCB 268]|nr:hypothetical protein [Pseudonocardia cytotoxica]
MLSRRCPGAGGRHRVPAAPGLRSRCRRIDTGVPSWRAVLGAAARRRRSRTTPVRDPARPGRGRQRSHGDLVLTGRRRVLAAGAAAPVPHRRSTRTARPGSGATTWRRSRRVRRGSDAARSAAPADRRGAAPPAGGPRRPDRELPDLRFHELFEQRAARTEASPLKLSDAVDYR